MSVILNNSMCHGYLYNITYLSIELGDFDVSNPVEYNMKWTWNANLTVKCLIQCILYKTTCTYFNTQ